MASDANTKFIKKAIKNSSKLFWRGVGGLVAAALVYRFLPDTDETPIIVMKWLLVAVAAGSAGATLIGIFAKGK
ncbi:hypothetical protein [Rhizorhabdus histidinilytica]